MVGKLTCKTGQLAGSVYFIHEEAVIGSSAECTIQLRSGVVSSKHAHLFYDKKKECYVLEDLKSRNGTRLDGEDIRGKKRLKTYHIIVLANTFEFVFQLAEEEQPAQQPPLETFVSDEDRMARTILVGVQQPTAQPASPPVERDEFVLEFKTVKGGKQSVTLKAGANTIGRSPGSDVVIDNPSISRHHAIVTVHGGNLSVKDEGSRNGTFVDERRIADEVQLTLENELRFGLVNASLTKRNVPGT